MTGFLNWFFKRKNDPTQETRPQSKSQAYFLDPDAAKSFGDIDYMRTSRTIRRTFMGGQYELIQAVSAEEKKEINESPLPPETSGSAAPASPDSTAKGPTQSSRRGGSDMDIFRAMAKDLGKKPKS